MNLHDELEDEPQVQEVMQTGENATPRTHRHTLWNPATVDRACNHTCSALELKALPHTIACLQFVCALIVEGLTTSEAVAHQILAQIQL